MIRKLLLFALIFTLFIVACTKISYTDLGNGIIPPIDGVNTKDTFFNVVTKNYLGDSIFVYKTDEHIVGNTNDPQFGKTSATVYTELMPGFFPYTYLAPKDSLTLDSVVLVLSYKGTWGDSMQNLRLKVHEISQSNKLRNNSTNNDTIYNNRKFFNYEPIELGSVVIDPRRLNDSVYTRNEAAKGQIRIKLSSIFGNKLLKVYDSSNVYKSDTTFRNNFAGFAVVADAGFGGNALIRLNLQDTNTKVAIYYKYKHAGLTDTTISYFRPGFTTSSHNYIKRDYIGAEINNFITSTNTSDSVVYLQAGPGTWTKVTIPGLSNMPNKIIHRAELQIEQVSNSSVSDAYFSTPLLFLNAFNDTMKHFFTSTDVEAGFSGVTNYASFGGVPFYKTDVFGNRVTYYTFNLSKYVQNVVTRKDTTYPFRLYAPYNSLIHYNKTSTLEFPLISDGTVNIAGIGRVRVGGGSHSSKKMRLRIIYSDL